VIASAMILRALGVENLGDGIMFGAIIGLGFLTATTVNTGINPNIPRPFLYGAISGSYFLVAGILNGAILTMIG
jgi:RsiW-degrading membrane proteinase PrsW (M82 family)